MDIFYYRVLSPSPSTDILDLHPGESSRSVTLAYEPRAPDLIAPVWLVAERWVGDLFAPDARAPDVCAPDLTLLDLLASDLTPLDFSLIDLSLLDLS